MKRQYFIYFVSPIPLQVGIYGEELAKDVDPLPTLVMAYPVRGSRLISIAQDEGIEWGMADGRALTLADTIAPHWFVPPEGERLLYILLAYRCTFMHALMNMYHCAKRNRAKEQCIHIMSPLLKTYIYLHVLLQEPWLRTDFSPSSSSWEDFGPVSAPPLL